MVGASRGGWKLLQRCHRAQPKQQQQARAVRLQAHATTAAPVADHKAQWPCTGPTPTWLNTSCSLLIAGMMLSPSDPLARKAMVGVPRGVVCRSIAAADDGAGSGGGLLLGFLAAAPASCGCRSRTPGEQALRQCGPGRQH